MKKALFFVILFCLILFPSYAYAGLFSMDKLPQENTSGASGPPIQTDEIPVFDKTDILIQKRLEEAHKLIFEGNKMIIKGEKRKDHALAVKGRIKKEIGEKIVKQLRDQAEQKKIEESKDGW